MERDQVIAYLKELNPKQFVELFYDATEGTEFWPEERAYWQSKLVLGVATRTLEDEWSPWQLETLCKHDPEEYPSGWVDDSPICQGGTCCEHNTLSYAKHAICPICSKKTYGT